MVLSVDPIPVETLEWLSGLSDVCDPGPWIVHIEGREFEGGASFIQTGLGDTRGVDVEIVRQESSGMPERTPDGCWDLFGGSRTYVRQLVEISQQVDAVRGERVESARGLVEVCRLLVGVDPGQRSRLVGALCRLVGVLEDAGEWTDARSVADEVLADGKGLEPVVRARVLGLRGRCARHLGDVVAAEADLGAARSVWAAMSPESVSSVEVAEVLGDLGLVLAARGDVRSAIQSMGEAITGWRGLLAGQDIGVRVRLARGLFQQGCWLAEVDRLDEASVVLEESTAVWHVVVQRWGSVLPDLGYAQLEYAKVLRQMGEGGEAQSRRLEAMQVFESLALQDQHYVEPWAMTAAEHLWANAGGSTQMVCACAANAIHVFRRIPKMSPEAEQEYLQVVTVYARTVPLLRVMIGPISQRFLDASSAAVEQVFREGGLLLRRLVDECGDSIAPEDVATLNKGLAEYGE